jgi:oxygen-independent coproporphyrinogen-3 oxidase
MEFSRDIHRIINVFYPNRKLEFYEENDSLDFVINIDKENISLKFLDKTASYKLNLAENSMVRAIQRQLFVFLREITGIKPPYGFLVGIRPSKIALDLIKKGFDKEFILDNYEKKYLVTKEKAELCYEVALLEAKYICEDKNIISIYIGMPFCPTRCSYCSFASNPIKLCGNLVVPYLEALKYEIAEMGKYLKEKNLKVQSIYFGGGTPTSVKEEEFEFIMKAIHENIYIHQNIEEYTVECGRPDSITEEKLLTMKKYSVDRISINPQTMNEHTLKNIGRGHSAVEVIEKFNLARRLNFDNINMDIILGLPGETIQDVNYTCEELLKLKPDSITVHGMSLKRASILHEEQLYSHEALIDTQRNEIKSMYEETTNLAEALALKPYYMYRQKNMVGNMENVGYCIKDKECIYNILMIEEKQTIIALGADAITKVIDYEKGSIERCANVKDVKLYIERIDEMIKNKIDALNKIYE